MNRARALVLVTFWLEACGPSYSELKVDQIARVAVTVDDPDQRFCAYQPVALRALVTYKNGKQVQSRVPGEGSKSRLRTSEFQWSANHGELDRDAVLLIRDDPLAWFDEPVSVSAQVIARPELVGQGALHPRFDCGGTLNLRGANGARGGEAEDGGPGEPGPDVEVALAYVDGAHSGRLVLVRVQRGSEAPEYFIIDPRDPQAPFVIDARGGNGGGGGQGNMGLLGIPGVDGRPGADGVECNGGMPGQDGTDGEPGGPGGPGANGGRGGTGGIVRIRHDSRFPELADHIRVRVEGGGAGEAGGAGPGGLGGAGGKGGTGGKGGKVTGQCEGADGASGRNGATGENGPSGSIGQPGRLGEPGAVHRSAVDVAELFAEEIGRGVPVVTETGAN